jgi:polysaccharide export outer membrane protein
MNCSRKQGSIEAVIMKFKKILFALTIFILFPAINAGARDYVIGGGDTLQISVWGSPELSVTAKVRPEGKISVPAIGDVMVAGLTAAEVKDLLERELKKVVKTPIVTVIVSDMTNYRVFVFGKGVPSGVHMLKRETTLLEFLSELGPMDNADLENSYLVRNKKRIKEDFSELYEKGDFSQDIVLEANDMLFIPDNFEKRITIVGAVGAPQTLPFRKGLTILDVILSAGGFNEYAKKNDVKIYRKNAEGKREEISVRAKDLMNGDIKENIDIKPGDFIVVKESLF